MPLIKTLVASSGPTGFESFHNKSPSSLTNTSKKPSTSNNPRIRTIKERAMGSIGENFNSLQMPNRYL